MARDATPTALPDIRVPAGLTFAGLAGGLILGLALGRNEGLLAVLQPVGSLWLKALQMTIMPLVIGLAPFAIATHTRRPGIFLDGAPDRRRPP